MSVADQHLHIAEDGAPLEPSAWSIERLRGYVEAAAARGVDELAITEHVYRFDVIRGVAPDPTVQPGPYWEELVAADIVDYRAGLREAAEAGLPVRAGVELDWHGGAVEQLRMIAREHDWDIVLGSIHWVGPWCVDWHLEGHYLLDVLSIEDGWRAYFAELHAAAESGLYDVMTHPDLPKIFGQRPAQRVLDELYAATAECFAEAGVAVEVNTAGLRKPVGELYPAPGLLAACHRAGVPASIGSDGHNEGDVSRDVDRAVALLHDVGYRSLARFRQRERREVPLP